MNETGRHSCRKPPLVFGTRCRGVDSLRARQLSSRFALLWLALALILPGCIPATPPAARPESLSRPSTPKHVVAAILGDPFTVSTAVNQSGAVNVPGINEVEELLNAALGTIDEHGVIAPRLAEDIPSLENGRWRLFADGRMETTWVLRPDTTWHDGTPFTSGDLLFTIAVGQDKALPWFGHVGYGYMESVEAPDSRTVVVKWKEPYIGADGTFTRFARQLPKHLLEKDYLEAKETFSQLPYWGGEFVGTGAFRLLQWERGSHMVMAANDRYPMGRPKVDEIEVRFLPDANAVIANMLAGAVDLSLGGRVSLEQSMIARDQWSNGKLDVGYRNWVVTYPQMTDPTPAIVLDARFRRALLHAVDRQEIADTLQGGLVPVAHSLVNPSEREYSAIERAIVRYEYDPRRAGQMIEELGYGKGADGMFLDRSGQRLAVEVFTTAENDMNFRSTLSEVDHWQRIGVAAETVVVPPQRSFDLAYVRSFSAFQTLQQPNDLDGLFRWHSSQAPLPENNFAGRNMNRYRNADYDRMIESYFVSVPWGDRMEALARIIRHQTEQMILLGMVYTTFPLLMNDRLLNLAAPRATGSNTAWNGHLWDVR